MRVSNFDAPRPGLFSCRSESGRRLLRSLLGAGILAAGFSLLVAGLGADNAYGADPTRPGLRAVVTVTSDLVTVGDFFDDAGPTAATPLFRAPDLGTTGSVPARRVLDLARNAGLSAADARGIAEVQVSRLARPVEADELAQIVAAAALRQPGRTGPDVALEDLRVVFDGTVEPHQADLRASEPVRLLSLSLSAQNGRFSALFAVDQGDGSDRFQLRGEVIETAAVTVFTREIARGEIIGRDDVRVDRLPRRQIGSTRSIGPEEVVGQAARRALRPGQPIAAGDVVRPQIVGRGDTVTVVFETGALTLTTRGQAMTAGTMGELVTVLNPQSKRTIHAVVTAPGKVTVANGATAVASLQR